jgi:hypothetical protein
MRVPSHYQGVIRRLNFRNEEECDIERVILELEVSQVSREIEE